jgi:hypothetical protein
MLLLVDDAAGGELRRMGLDAEFASLLRLILGMLLQGWIGGWAVGFAVGWNSESKGVGQVEADEGFGGDLDLFASGDGVGSGTDATAGRGSDGCAFASAEDAAENGSDGCSAADLLGGIGSAALALDAVGVGVDGEFFAAAIDAGEFDGEERTACACSLLGGDAAGDGGALRDDRPSMSAAMVPVKRSPCWVWRCRGSG